MVLTWKELDQSLKDKVREAYDRGRADRFYFFEMQGTKKPGHRQLTKLLKALEECGGEARFALNGSSPQLAEESAGFNDAGPIELSELLEVRVRHALASLGNQPSGRHPDWHVDAAIGAITEIWVDNGHAEQRGQDPRSIGADGETPKISPFIQFVADGLMDVDGQRFNGIAVLRAYDGTAPRKKNRSK